MYTATFNNISVISWRSVLFLEKTGVPRENHKTGQWFFPGNLVSSTNKTDLHNITEILLKVELKIINLNEFVYFKGFNQLSGELVKVNRLTFFYKF